MTPKEKAIELFEKNYEVFICDEDEHYLVAAKRIAKECALIAVDEVLKSQKNIYGVNNKATKFYLEVKQELENL